jgi:hypothetical protein
MINILAFYSKRLNNVTLFTFLDTTILNFEYKLICVVYENYIYIYSLCEPYLKILGINKLYYQDSL